MKLYIAGKIAGEDGYGAKFHNASLEVVEMGHEPVNPCELHTVCAKQHLAWEQWMVCDIHAMIDCDGVYALRDWQSSPGATVEVNLARSLKKQILFQDNAINALAAPSSDAAEIVAEMAREAATRAAGCRSALNGGDEDVFALGAESQHNAMAAALREAERRIRAANHE